MDIDDFKLVNYYFGHDIGDQILVMVANRLNRWVSLKDLVVRLSGEEFLLIIQIEESINKIELVASSILTNLKQTYEINKKNINISCSIGIWYYPNHGDNIEVLIKKSDLAMYESKK